MYPQGHSRADASNLASLLAHKCRLLTEDAVADVDALVARFSNLADNSPKQIADLYNFQIRGVST
jgi:hypothetical protein